MSKTQRQPSPVSNINGFESNSKLQEDLSELQNKLSFLEQKFSHFAINPNCSTSNNNGKESKNEIFQKNSFFFNVKFVLSMWKNKNFLIE